MQLAESFRGRRRHVPLSHGLSVRAIEPARVRALAESAAGEDTDRGALCSWIEVNEGKIEHAFAIELREYPSRSDVVVCFLLLLNSQNRCGYARIELGKTDFGKLRTCRRDELHMIALSLAVRSALLSAPDTKPV